MHQEENQIDLPFPLDPTTFTTFLTRWIALEDEEIRLREEKRLLKEEYADELPLRGVLTAIKIVRAQRALEAHPKEPMALTHLAYLEALVEQHLDRVATVLEAMQVEAQALVQGSRP